MGKNIYSAFGRTLGAWTLGFAFLFSGLSVHAQVPSTSCNYNADLSTFINGDQITAVTVGGAPLSLTGLNYQNVADMVTEMQAAPFSYSVVYDSVSGLLSVQNTTQVFNSVSVQNWDGTSENLAFTPDCSGSVVNPKVEKTSNPTSGSLVNLGSSLTYRFNFTTNRDYDSATFLDTLPAGLTFLSVTDYDSTSMDFPLVSVSTDPNTGQEALTFTITNLKAGDSSYVEFNAQVNGTIGANFSNTITQGAGAFGGGTDVFDIAGNPTHTIAQPDIYITKNSATAGSSLMTGDYIDYVFTIQTQKPYLRAVVSDFLMEGLAFDSVVNFTGITSSPFTSITVDPNDGREMLQIIADNPPVGTSTVTIRVNITDDAVSGNISNSIFIAHGEHSATGIDYSPNINPPVTHSLTQAELMVSKASDTNGSCVSVGDQIVYTITATNTSNDPIYNLIIRDNLPTEVTYLSGDAEVFPPTVGPGGQIVSVQLGVLNPNETRDFDFVVEVSSYPPSGQITNSIQNVYGNSINNVPSQVAVGFDTVGVTDCIDANGPAVKITKTPHLGYERVGPFELIKYSFHIENIGTVPLTSLTLTDNLINELDFVSTSLAPASTCTTSPCTLTWNLPMIFPSQSISFDLEVRPNNLAMGLTPELDGYIDLVNTATISTSPTTNTLPATSTVEMEPQGFSIQKSVNAGTTGSVNVGDVLTYSVTVTPNNGQMIDLLTVKDSLDAALNFVSSSSLGVSGGGQTVDLQFTGVTAPQTKTFTAQVVAMPMSGQVCNGLNNLSATQGGQPVSGGIVVDRACVTVSSSTSSATSSTSTSGNNPTSFTVNKSNVTVGAITLGGFIDYEVVLTANSSSSIYGVTAIDQLPPEVSFVSGDPGVVSSGSLLILSAPVVSQIPTTLTYKVKLNTLPASGQITNTIIDAYGYYPNSGGLTTSVVSVNGGDDIAYGDISNASTTITIGGGNSGSNGTFSVKKTSEIPTTTTLTPGDTFDYTIEITVPTGANFSQIQVKDTLPPELSSVSPLPAGVVIDPLDAQSLILTFNNPQAGTLSKTFTVKLNQNTVATQICNTIVWANGTEASGSIANGNVTGGTVCHEVGQVAPAYVASKTSALDGGTYPANLPFTFELKLANTGNVDLQNAYITDTLPSSWTFLSASGATVTSQSGNQIKVDFGVLPAGSEETATITAQSDSVSTSAVCNNAADLTFNAEFNNQNINPSQNTGQACIVFSDGQSANPADFLTIEKTANYQNGETIGGTPQVTYSLKITNTSPTITFSNLVVTDNLPSGVNFMSSTNQSVTHANGTVSYALASLTPSTSQSFSFTTQFPPMNLNLQIQNQASVIGLYAGVPTDRVYSNQHTLIGSGTQTPAPTPNLNQNQSSFSSGGGSAKKFGLDIFEAMAGLEEVAPSSELTPDFDPNKPLCRPVICPACMKPEIMDISKEVYDHAPKVNGWVKEAAVAYGQVVNYRADLNMKVSNAQNYEITGGEVYFYDVTEPMTNAGFSGVFGRIVETNGLPWKSVSGAANQYRINLNEIVQDGKRGTEVLNDGEQLQIPIEYAMRSDLVPTTDYGIGIGNIAFAVALLEYTDTDNDVVFFHVEELGDNILEADQCQNTIEDQLVSHMVQPGVEGFATFGAETAVNIFRPLVAARQGGALTVKTSNEGERLFSTEIPDRKIHLDYIDQVVYTNDETNFESESAKLEDIKEALANNVDKVVELADSAIITTDLASFFPNESAAGQFKKVQGQNIYFFDGEELVLDGTYALNQPITIIIPRGDLVIAGDATFPVSLPGFLLKNGDIYVEKKVEQVDGVYVLEGEIILSEVRSYDSLGVDDTSPYQLNWNGLLLGGNPEHLFKNRLYLGENPFADAEDGGGIEPSIEFVLDPRLIENEPVGFTQILGADWQQKIQ